MQNIKKKTFKQFMESGTMDDYNANAGDMKADLETPDSKRKFRKRSKKVQDKLDDLDSYIVKG